MSFSILIVMRSSLSVPLFVFGGRFPHLLEFSVLIMAMLKFWGNWTLDWHARAF